jgi:hypothetical protein
MLEEHEKIKKWPQRKFHQPKYVWMINTELNLEKIDAYVKYQGVNFSHSRSVMFFMLQYRNKLF